MNKILEKLKGVITANIKASTINEKAVMRALKLQEQNSKLSKTPTK